MGGLVSDFDAPRRLPAEYLRKLTDALEAVAKTVPKVTMDRSTPMARWCELRPIVRRAVEAAQRLSEQCSRRHQGLDGSSNRIDSQRRVDGVCRSSKQDQDGE